MKKLIINENSDFFIKVIQPKIDRLKISDPFDDFSYKTLNYYNKKVWEIMEIPVDKQASLRASRARSFSRAKKQIFFNPDLRYFVTLTYKENMQDYEKLLTDMKVYFKTERRNGKEPKYLWVAEKQKRGALHVHMICNDFITLEKNKYNKLTLKHWPHGFDNIEDITIYDKKNTDLNFKPFLYLYKYMNKSERVGGRFVHTSRNLNNFQELTDFNFDKKQKKHLYTELSTMGDIDTTIKRVYYSDII